MDTLVVGQEVHIVSGVYGCKGRVVTVTPDSVEVLVEAYKEDELLRAISEWPPEDQKNFIAVNKAKLFRFDKDGNETDASRRDRLGFGPSPDDKFHTVLWDTAPECQPWHLDMPRL
jgi:hypothetical protein